MNNILCNKSSTSHPGRQKIHSHLHRLLHQVCTTFFHYWTKHRIHAVARCIKTFVSRFGRHPRTPMEVDAAEENPNVSVPSEEDISTAVANREYNMELIKKKVESNSTKARDSQKQTYAARKAKGVKYFFFKKGDHVLRKNMRKQGRKGGKMEASWSGHFEISDIDGTQRVTLVTLEGYTLKTRVPYGQLKPHRSPVSTAVPMAGPVVEQCTYRKHHAEPTGLPVA
ncbi:PREDICTED: uncharacterized protein LOC106809268 [Priapulus caudatus]|uniref:Uncharacterized protein LOC106809268 n=1 Tax=Priapulus caudatus TaxID=37621 RepID=A0ABM1E6E4_PRICU|nr:PREDICTED: uncharacterized protein LOC106809268 [Priapulus caudatus]